MMLADDPKLVFIPVDEATTPPPGMIQHFRDYWWVVHPERGLVFYRNPRDKKHLSPQCNLNETITQSIREKLYPWAEVRQVPSVFRSINVNDYCH